MIGGIFADGLRLKCGSCRIFCASGGATLFIFNAVRAAFAMFECAIALWDLALVRAVAVVYWER